MLFDGSSCDDLLKVVTLKSLKETLVCGKQSLPVGVYPLSNGNISEDLKLINSLTLRSVGIVVLGTLFTFLQIDDNWIYIVGSKSFLFDIQKPRQIENAVKDI